MFTSSQHTASFLVLHAGYTFYTHFHMIQIQKQQEGEQTGIIIKASVEYINAGYDALTLIILDAPVITQVCKKIK